MARVFIVEDELIIQATLESMLRQMGHEVVGKAAKAEKAIELIDQLLPELVLLDINLGQGANGITVAAKLHERGTAFMYVTSYADQETLKQATQYLPSSFLVKPFVKEDLFVAIEMALLHSGQNVKNKDESFLVSEGSVIRRLDPTKIYWVKADNVYVEVKTEDRRLVIRDSISKFFEKLPAHHFFRIHRSYIVNLTMIDTVGANFVEIKGEQIPLSRNVRSELTKKMSEL